MSLNALDFSDGSAERGGIFKEMSDVKSRIAGFSLWAVALTACGLESDGGLSGSGVVVAPVIQGKAELIADFQNSQVSETISERVAVGEQAATFIDVTLTSTAMTDGAFSGLTTDGRGTGGLPTTTLNGSYRGLIVGPDGTDAVGSVAITHTFSFGDRVEWGDFTARDWRAAAC